MDADTGFTDLGVLPCTLDAGIAARAAIGLLVLATDQTMEHEFRHLIRLPGVAVYRARLFNDADITPDTLRAIGDRIAPATELILPSLHLDVVAFGCTSASMTLGRGGSVPPDPPRAAGGCLHHAGDRGVCCIQGAGRAADRRADTLFAGGECRGARVSGRARRRGRGVRDVRQARRSRGGADLSRLDRRGRSPPWRAAHGWMRCSCRAPVCGWPRTWRRSRRRWASRSPPAITRWPGTACGSRG